VRSDSRSDLLIPGISPLIPIGKATEFYLVPVWKKVRGENPSLGRTNSKDKANLCWNPGSKYLHYTQ